MSWTKAPVKKFTPRGRSQATRGFMNASCWLKGERRTPAIVDRSENK